MVGIAIALQIMNLISNDTLYVERNNSHTG